MSDQRKCRVCGCTEDTACLTPTGPCHWAEADLCSACVAKESGALPGEFPLVLDLQTLEALREPVGMQLSAQHLFMLVATVQLALRHPAFQGSTRDFAEEWALEAAAELARIAPALKPVLLAGFKPEHDVPAGQAEKRIIVPGA